VGVTNRRDDVRGARSARDHGDARTTSSEGVPFGHVTRALLVAHQNMADARVDQRVIDRQDGPAGQAEDGVDALLFEALDEACAPESCTMIL